MDPAADRRRRRHDETRQEILKLAVELMGEDGVAGLSLGEVARRLGVRTPSLYTYFESKGALYDELFRRGWQACLEAVSAHRAQLGPISADTDAVARAIELHGSFIRWALANPELSQLMMTRPVPRWQPSAEAYAPSVELMAGLADELRLLRDHGLLAANTDLDELTQNIATVGTGVILRQLANEPGAPYGDAAVSRHFPALLTALITAHLPGRTKP